MNNILFLGATIHSNLLLNPNFKNAQGEILKIFLSLHLL